MIKNIGKSILFMFILFLLIAGISCLLLPWRAVKKYGILYTANYPILSEEENTIDAVVVGDSLVYSGINPMVVWDKYGYTMYDCALAGQIPIISYETIQESINSQHPKVIFLESDVLFRNPKNIPIDTIKLWLTNRYIPIINYHDNWKKYLFNFLNNDKKFTKFDFYKGYHLIKKIKPAPKSRYNYMEYSKEYLPIVDENIEYFNKIVKLCEKNEVKLVLISIPNLKLWNYKKHNSISDLANKYNLEFIDFNLDNLLKINWQIDVKDGGGHLNFRGAYKVSDYLGNYLKDSGLVKDHRKDKKYQSWNESYKIYTS